MGDIYNGAVITIAQDTGTRNSGLKPSDVPSENGAQIIAKLALGGSQFSLYLLKQ